jgi:ATP-dependent DNA helicase RecG
MLPDLSLQEIFALDRVQKKIPIDDAVAKHLRRAKLIEGRKPNFYVSAIVAAATASKADYIRTRAQDDDYYTKLIRDYLVNFRSATRKEIDELLWDKLSDVLNHKQKQNKIGNLITSMRQAETIINTGSRKAPQWILKE